MLVLSTPIHYNLELIPQCNNQCIGCGNVIQAQTRSLLSATQWKDVLNMLGPHAANIRLSGGEPTLHPEFVTIVKALRELSTSFILFTNGCWQYPDMIIKTLCNTEQFKGLLISLHGADQDVHESFTQTKGSFAQTLDNIKKCSVNGLTVASNTVITSINYNEISKIIALSTETGAERSVFARYIPIKNNKITPSPYQLKTAVTAVETHRSNGSPVSFSVCIPQCFTPSSSEGCLSGVSYCVIDPYGNVRPCTHSPIICGNLLDQPIEDIWHGSKMQAWREMIPVQCHDCLEFSECHGGCRAAALANSLEKDPLMDEPVQEKKKSPEKIVSYKGAYPIGHFTLRSEPFGYALMRGSRVIPVAHHAKSLLDTLNGRYTLVQIGEHFGQQALNFVGLLYQKGLVEFRETPSE